jgi:uncharacterized integral membrane protein
MQKIIESYFSYLSQNPIIINSIFQWTLCTLVVWFVEFKYRDRIVSGLEGINKMFESAEVVIFIVCVMFPPIVFHSVFFNLPFSEWNWYFIIGVIAFAMGGRWIFEWVLALKTGQSSVHESTKEVIKSETVETKKETISN